MCNRLPEINKNGDAGIFPVYYSLKHSSRSCTVGVQKYICIVHFASGLSRILSKLLCFDKESFCTDILGSGNVLLEFR